MQASVVSNFNLRTGILITGYMVCGGGSHYSAFSQRLEIWWIALSSLCSTDQSLNFIAAIAVEGEQNAVDYCCNDGNFLPYSVIFILFTLHYYFDT
jgi:hypothetical protein